jgi:class 3 adenylate cyclase
MSHAAVNYRPRIIGGGFLVLMVLAGVPDELRWMPALWIWIVLGLSWPHAALMLTRWARDSRRAERRNVLGDSLTFGFNAALVGFQLWASVAMVVIALINAVMFGGLRFLRWAALLAAMGVALSIAAFGWRVQLDSSPATIAISATAIIFYVGYIALTAYQLRVRQRDTRIALEREERRSHELLLNVFPVAVVPRLRAGESPIADQFADVTVVFADIVEFTPLAERLGPAGTVRLLNDLFRKFDVAAAKLGVEKIETTGDGYLAVAGAPQLLERHAQVAADFALAVVEAARSTAVSGQEHVRLRVGVHTGPVLAGVIGESRFHYKIFGETVNMASRIQGHSQPGRVLVSEASYKRIHATHMLEERGIVDLKGHGPMRTYWLTARGQHTGLPEAA